MSRKRPRAVYSLGIRVCVTLRLIDNRFITSNNHNTLIIPSAADEEDELDGHSAQHAADAAAEAEGDALALRRAQRRQARRQPVTASHTDASPLTRHQPPTVTTVT